MLWSKDITYYEETFEHEAELEEAIQEVATPLFGDRRIYLNLKKKIGGKNKTQNLPDGYLIDLTSKREPKLYVVENELAKHEPLKHIAVQILEFSLSFETASHKVKEILKGALQGKADILRKCQDYAEAYGFENVDYLLERMIYPDDSFNALVIIDEVSEELEKALLSRFKFPVEILTLQRYVTQNRQRIYRFEPFLHELGGEEGQVVEGGALSKLDPSEIDTIVVPARDEGFEEVFLCENRWYKIRIHSTMISRIKYVAGYRVAPTSAITHYADVRSIQQWEETSKYVVNFAGPAKAIGPIPLLPKSRIKAPQGPRYTSMARLEQAEKHG